MMSKTHSRNDIPEAILQFMRLIYNNPGKRLTVAVGEHPDGTPAYMLCFAYQEADIPKSIGELCDASELTGDNGLLSLLPLAEIRADWMNRVIPTTRQDTINSTETGHA